MIQLEYNALSCTQLGDMIGGQQGIIGERNFAFSYLKCRWVSFRPHHRIIGMNGVILAGIQTITADGEAGKISTAWFSAREDGFPTK